MGNFEQLVANKGDEDVKLVRKDDVKEDLLGKEFFITEWEFLKSKQGNTEYVKATVLLPDDKTTSFIDGAEHGIYKQLKEYTTKTGKTDGFYAKYGLAKDVFYKNMSTNENSSNRLPGYTEVAIYSIAHK